MKKVVVGLSGGVDSAVAASLLTKEYEVYGVTLQMQGDCFDYEAADGNVESAAEGRRTDNTVTGKYTDDTATDRHAENSVMDGHKENAAMDGYVENAAEGRSAVSDDVRDAAAVAARLGIHYEAVDCSREFAGVKNCFCREYLNGRTPNPCVLCNPAIKWKALLDYADSIGAEYVATGHYAFIDRMDNGRYALRAADSSKDQTYVLYGLSQQQLARTIMPLGAYDKTEVRTMAAALGLAVADKPDSMEICFVPDGDYTGFISGYTGITKPEGNFVDESGRVLAGHKGITHYTVGQRKGLGVGFGRPMYVKEIRPETDEVVLSPEDIYADTVSFENVKLMGAAEINIGETYFAKVRYSHKAQKCSIIGVGPSEITGNASQEITVAFDPPVRAATPGQSAVLYDGDGRVMCGGIIK